MTVSSKRAEQLSWAALILSVIFFATAYFLSLWSGYLAVYAASWMILLSAAVWFVLCLQFHQRCLAEQEKLDMSQLTKEQQDTTLFQAKGERATLFAVAQRRLQLFEKWFLPIFSVIIAVYQIGIGLYLLRLISAGVEVELRQPLICSVFMAAIAFVNFLISRYATGMSASSSAPAWKPLRAGGSYMLAIAVLCFALAIGLALAQFKIFAVLTVVSWVIGVLLIVVGAETALNVIADIYRPRLKGRYSRSAFDSRVLGVINEPGGIFHTTASAIDYQFGFKVSQTWFYKLLEKAVVPLVIFAFVILYLLSTIVIVGPNEQAIIEHFGNPLDQAGNVRLAEPGLTFKWPWPFDITYKFSVKKISKLSIGFVPEIDPKTGQQARKAKLWGGEHHHEEYNLLVAVEQDIEDASIDGAVSVSLVAAAIPVQYRVKDLYSFTYNNADPEELLESICYRELTKLAASATIEVDNEAGIEKSILGAGRAKLEETLAERIQKGADEAKLGVEIVFVGLRGLHPPHEIAEDYQKVIGAVQQKQASILYAHLESNGILTTLAGSLEAANSMYSLAEDYLQAKRKKQSEKIKLIEKRLDDAFAQASGDIFKTLREAESYAFEKVNLAKANGERFGSQLQAYRAAKEFYMREQRLAVLEESLINVRKYVVVADSNDTQVFIIDVQEKLAPSLYELSGFEE